MTAMLLSAAAPSSAAVSNWQFGSGLPPQQSWPAWELKLGGSPLPTATALTDALQINSGSNWYQYMYYEQSGGMLAFPSSLVIEVRMRVVSSATVGNTYCPCEIHWTPGNGAGNGLGFRAGQIFLWQSGNTAATPVNIDTTSALHTYRIEVDGIAAGSAIRVYQDGSQVLTGATYSDASWHGSTPRIYWGDGTTNGSAVSDWASFRHNALAALPVKNSSILFGYVGKNLSTFSTANGLAKTILPDPNVPASPFNHVYQLTAQPGTGMLYGLIQPQVGSVQKSKLLRVDPFTGQSADVGFIQTADSVIQYVEGLAFNPVTGELYGSMHVTGNPENSSPNLILIDPNSGMATQIGTLPTGATKETDIDALAFSSDGTMYASDGHALTSEWGSYLYRIQQTSPGVWSASHLGTRLAKLLAGFAYSPEEGVFYCTEPDNRKLHRVTTSMATTEIGTIHPSVTGYGLAFTSPITRSPLAVTLQSGGLSIRCPSFSGLTYQLWSSADLTQWQPFGSPVDGSGTLLEWPVPIGPASAQFFRAQVLDSP